jgi:hypothetical protein
MSLSEYRATVIVAKHWTPLDAENEGYNYCPVQWAKLKHCVVYLYSRVLMTREGTLNQTEKKHFSDLVKD